MKPQTPPWMAYAECQGVDPDIFFPEHDFSAKYQVAQAKQFCNVCAAKKACLNYAIANGEVQGVWGGMTPQERRQERRRRGLSRPVGSAAKRWSA
jgi:WhiB family redox-sensing transcriptional regulator